MVNNAKYKAEASIVNYLVWRKLMLESLFVAPYIFMECHRQTGVDNTCAR